MTDSSTRRIALCAVGIVVATMPATKPTTMTPRVPTRICEKTSCPRWVVPNQCSHEGGSIAQWYVNRGSSA